VPPQVARFHADTGPQALFDRVRQVFDSPRSLQLHGDHLAERTRTAAAPPMADLERFDPHDWELMLVEARTDTGLFVSTTWRRRYDAVDWWLVIGYHDVVRTLYQADPRKRGKGPSVVTGGPVWRLVERANASLLADRDTAPDSGEGRTS
jgi:hypothetical protein